jgi:PKHD-type hydroxylase
MLYIDNAYQQWIDYLLINGNSPTAAREFMWTKSECAAIKNASNFLERVPAQINSEDQTVDESFRKVNRWLIPNSEKFSWIYTKVCNTLLSANKDFWNLDVNIIETLELLQYKFDPTSPTQDHYNKHSDFGGNFTTRKISYTALLSDPSEFDGGDLILYLRTDITLPKEQGQVVLFPSIAFHEVLPVTQGERWALVTWIKGRPLR